MLFIEKRNIACLPFAARRGKYSNGTLNDCLINRKERVGADFVVLAKPNRIFSPLRGQVISSLRLDDRKLNYYSRSSA